MTLRSHVASSVVEVGATMLNDDLFGSILELWTRFSCPIGHYSCPHNRFLLVCIEICQFGQIGIVFRLFSMKKTENHALGTGFYWFV